MKNVNTGRLVRLAVLAAIVLLMAYTPVGYLKVGALEITFLMIPVVIGSIILGPAAGAVLGGLFGLTSFIQCFGASLFGATLMGINPIFTFITCMVPRILAGWIPGIAFKALDRLNVPKTASVVAASILGPVLNTVLFVGSLILLFGKTDYIMSFGDNVWAIVVVLVGLNGVIEAVVGFIVGAAASRALIHFLPAKPAKAEAGE